MDHNAYSFQIQFHSWTLSIRQKYQQIINKPNRMPKSSTRPNDITPDRFKMLTDINFDFKAVYCDPSIHPQLYAHQKRMEKNLQNIVISEKNLQNLIISSKKIKKEE